MSSTEQLNKSFHVAVIGGGIGGLCMGIGLLHQKISCTIYESAPAFAEIVRLPSKPLARRKANNSQGAGVSFGPNAIRAMALIDPAIQKGFENCVTSNAYPEKKDVWFDFRMGMAEEGWKDLEGKQPPAKEGDYLTKVIAAPVGQASVHRAHFLDELVKLIPVENAQFGKRLQNIEEKDGRLQLTFRDGTTAEADAVIGCDGMKSSTRRIVLGDNHHATLPQFTGKYAYRGLVPMEKAVEVVGDELARNSQMYLGHHGHIVTFPIEKGETMNVVAFQTKKDGKWENENWVLPMKESDMSEDFKDWGKDVKHVLSLMQKPDIWALFDHPPAPTYYKNCIALLGDAAHASTPYQGAGAGQAIEDAFVLSNLLGDITDAGDIEKAFHAYDAVRRPRSQKVVTTSREAASIYEFEDAELGMDLQKIRQRVDQRYKWIWDEDLPAQLERAREIMRG
ncbi:mannitol 1-phosphate dehydrogenase protein [Rutstroemia sp. NJR-2017a BBW]|nr:mannitol 1-phosphate dehydrogenase protein [Rutstroemia sp. NJR-2017a BBW]PQE08594.1 mannitol 1-phosphate dehydrogenase protein [Rutstroemia sp. NJR-2017a BBW]